MYALPTLLVASLNKPAKVFFPLLVAEVLSAPVPAYVLLSLSPLSAQSSRCAAQKDGLSIRGDCTEDRKSAREREERTSWT